MKHTFLITALCCFAAFCFVMALVNSYNGLIKKFNQVKNAFSTIDVMLKKRYDLIPNLIELVKQYSSHEEKVLTDIASLRATGMSATLSNEEKMMVNRQLDSAVRGMMVNMEAYPELKANESFLRLQSTWTESEEQIAAARRNYNNTVTVYNNGIMMFPSNIFASILNYKPIFVLENTQEERKNISAKAIFNS
ncbi:LemA family protein [Pedobacter sp. KBW06]|uniref:LemA family protein n=1 Tax=Pedobacter sp. KBW06 TaxID=2153359 RepID=UPI001F17B2C1|nr:LemA family protein [Pedobacter sp. KBW06]